jgi:GT2 family glycosyltransferase/glycosyltransferase involved in cell wall biosynthesis
MRKQNELFNAVLKELAAKEKELADQKWVFERFLESPAWRWTAPIRWAVNQFRGLKNGHDQVRPPDLPTTSRIEQAEPADSMDFTSGLEAKAYFEEFCRMSLQTFLESGAALTLPQSANPAVSIILVLFNRAELTLACLRSIAENRSLDLEVVIVDNASQDETHQVLDRLGGARIFKNDSNRHFLAAANQAARECRGEYLLLLNNDAQLLPGAIENALRTIRSSSDIGAVGGKIILLDGTLQEAGSIVWKDGSCTGYGRGDDPSAAMYNFRRDVDYCSGAFLLTSRKTWEELKGFDPVFEPAYYEETDYCMRLWDRGLRVVYEPTAAILHYEFASSRSMASATRLQARNQKVFADRHHATLQGKQEPGVDKLVHARSRHAQRRILFVDDRVPHSWLGSGFPRANAMHRVLHGMGYFITSYPVDVIDEPWQQAYSDLPREIELMLGMGRHLLDPFLRNRRGFYSTIIVSRPHNMQVIASIRMAHPECFENVNVIYDAEALFAEREVSRRKMMGSPMTEAEIRAVLESEIQLAAQADCVVTVSKNEEKLFHSRGIKRVEVLGHSIDVIPGNASFDARKGFLFVGAVHSETSPNADSLIWFLEKIFPIIRQKLGDVPFTIAGLNRSERLQALAQPPARVMGYLPNLDDLYATARVFVAPTRFAAGIPHKIHEAAARGLPVVATPLLARQLGWSDQELALAETAEAFAERCIELYTNKEKWISLREAAIGRVREECSPRAFEEGVRRLNVV